MKNAIKSLLKKSGYEIRTKDSSLPILHKIKLDDLSFPFWLTNIHAKSWWYKPALELNAEFEFIKKNCKAGGVAIDVGAHHGIQTIPMALWSESDREIFAFEANKENAITLQANINLNKLTNCYAYWAAIGSKTDTVQMSGESISNSSDESVSTQCYSLDDFCEQNSIDKVNLIKIDVEGYEFSVLKGAKKLLTKLPNISLELHIDELKKFGSNVSELQELISWQDYIVTQMNRSMNWKKTEPIKSIQDLPDSGIVNLFFQSIN